MNILSTTPRYAGTPLTPEGRPAHHLFLLDARPNQRMTWQQAKDWAASVGGELPTPQEQSLLFANCRDALPQERCWSSKQDKEEASYAWYCNFSNGYQSNYLKSYEGSAVAVRRLPLESFNPFDASAPAPATTVATTAPGAFTHTPRPAAAGPVHWHAHNTLYRAIVSLPQALCPRDEPLHERIVFFDGPRKNPGEYLETLLAHAWHTDTIGWCHDGLIYNLQSAAELVEQGLSEDRNARLLETGWGGPEGISYAEAPRTDFFVAPELRKKLYLLQTQVRIPKAWASATKLEGSAA